jgi:hypothetical protein
MLFSAVTRQVRVLLKRAKNTVTQTPRRNHSASICQIILICNIAFQYQNENAQAEVITQDSVPVASCLLSIFDDLLSLNLRLYYNRHGFQNQLLFSSGSPVLLRGRRENETAGCSGALPAIVYRKPRKIYLGPAALKFKLDFAVRLGL